MHVALNFNKLSNSLCCCVQVIFSVRHLKLQKPTSSILSRSSAKIVSTAIVSVLNYLSLILFGIVLAKNVN